ncbi:glycosyltransferase family 39 protein [Mucilaginibacter daejeonensis]|uniref:ArnT family glycosyltransferase n=1 Tax=Mucilaginibacter daejeonensis TaxID=398049 RepID=UPI001D1740C3|nr:glycosyltransferase family 39 protein [Mucilaginibacter daejeonensis]UEG53880.1 glycosyltransferase family 39 protein [Mucilaginibacter daejeonensis]
MPTSTLNKTVSDRYLLFFLLGWTVLNILQSCTLGLHSDEAYYWVYSRFLDWGYYDHPPMVAIFIRIGDSLLHNELGLRFMTILTSTCSMYVMWLMAKRYGADVRWFIVSALSIFAFHMYGFNTTPDAPLLFFTVLFYYLYQRYLEHDAWRTTLLLGIVVAGLFYSKYHAVLLIIFTLAANIKLLKRPSFYAIVAIAGVLYIPHILWQVQHDYASARYHLFERSSETYEFAHTYLFVPGQLLMAGPLIGWFLIVYGFGTRIKDVFIRTLMVNGFGIFIFFLINTLKGNVQPHWTLIAFVPVLLLTLIRTTQGHPPAWAYKLAWINAGLIVGFRLLLISGLPAITRLPALKEYFGYREWARSIHQKAGNAFVISPMGFQEISKYNYYTRSLKGFAYDEAFYRRTQYDIWPIEDSMQHHRAYYINAFPHTPNLIADSTATTKGTWYGTWVNDVRTYQKADIITDNYKVTAKPGQRIQFKLKIHNPYSDTIKFDSLNTHSFAVLRACFYQREDLKSIQRSGAEFKNISIAPNQFGTYDMNLTAPMEKGRYDLIFSIRTYPFNGGRNSRIVNFTVQ